MAKKRSFKSTNQKKQPTASSQVELFLPKKVFTLLVGVVAFYCIFSIINLFLADISYATGRKLNEGGSYEEAIKHFEEAVKLNPREPAYHRDYAFALAKLAKMEQKYVGKAAEEAQIAYRLNPKNSLTLKKLVSVYYTLSEIDPKYNAPLLQLSLEIADLAPTEPRPRYDQALIFVKLGLKEGALESASKALELKPDYPEAQQLHEILTSESQENKR